MNLQQLMLFALLFSPAAAGALLAAEQPVTATNLPADAQKAITEFDAQVVALQKKAEAEMEAIRKRTAQEILAAREECRKALKVLQDTYTKAGKLDEAVAIRDRSATLAAGGEVLPDPRNLIGYDGHVGKTLYIEVVGTADGSVYGDGVYTTDSKIATAAVHVGVLKVGQRGIVKVTILAGQSSYPSVGRNGILSSGWGAYNTSYKVEATSLVPVPEKK